LKALDGEIDAALKALAATFPALSLSKGADGAAPAACSWFDKLTTR
jgi:hypothetical protein